MQRQQEYETTEERMDRIDSDLVEVECEARSDLYYDEDLSRDLKEKCGLSDQQVKAVLERFEPIVDGIAHHSYWFARGEGE